MTAVLKLVLLAWLKSLQEKPDVATQVLVVIYNLLPLLRVVLLVNRQ